MLSGNYESGAFFSLTGVGVVGVWQHVSPSVSDTCTIVHGFQAYCCNQAKTSLIIFASFCEEENKDESTL